MTPLPYLTHTHTHTRALCVATREYQSKTLARRCAVYLLYWYKSTCFTGTKVSDARVSEQDAGEKVRSLVYLLYWYQSTCFTGTKVSDARVSEQDAGEKVRSLLALLVPKYLLYWYQSTITDAAQPAADC
jgi:hypothetical protein